MVFHGTGLFHAAKIPFSNEQQLKHLIKRSIPTPSNAFTCLDQKLRIKRFVIFLHHLDIRLLPLPYLSKHLGMGEQPRTHTVALLLAREHWVSPAGTLPLLPWSRNYVFPHVSVALEKSCH